jgi:hypothetical protein
LDTILHMRVPDVQAALTVLGGGTFAAPLDLHGTDLRRADLTGANLGEARLGGADLKVPCSPGRTSEASRERALNVNCLDHMLRSRDA